MKVLVAGASGLVGEAALRHFSALPGWEAVGVSRRVPPDMGSARHIKLDLDDEAACRQALGGMTDVTHVVYAALHEVPGLFPGWTDEPTIEKNARMLRNFFEPVAAAATGLQHVSLLHGTKAYGLHHPDVGVAGVHNPLVEREPRREHRNFYFLQEDYLREKQAGASWGLTVFRPTVIYGGSWGANMNPIPPLAAYAALLREEGEPLHFPGRSLDGSVREAVDADLVAEALAWAAAAPSARGETFNLTNGDVFTWQHAWPAIAEALGMEPGEQRPISLAAELPKRGDAWAALVDRHKLRAPRGLLEFVGYNSLVYTDMLLAGAPRSGGPILNSTIKGRLAGFAACMDTEEMFRKWFRRLREQRVIP
jgi:nucleoside-diphosphate-sugar epimerase